MLIICYSSTLRILRILCTKRKSVVVIITLSKWTNHQQQQQQQLASDQLPHWLASPSDLTSVKNIVILTSFVIKGATKTSQPSVWLRYWNNKALKA